jgi:hypothetical protein
MAQGEYDFFTLASTSPRAEKIMARKLWVPQSMARICRSVIMGPLVCFFSRSSTKCDFVKPDHRILFKAKNFSRLLLPPPAWQQYKQNTFKPGYTLLASIKNIL